MLPGVLLHVVESPLPVDGCVNRSPRDQRLRGEMPDFAAFIFLDLVDGDFQNCAVEGGRRQSAAVVGLAATGWVESRAIQSYLPERFAASARDQANVGDDRVEPG